MYRISNSFMMPQIGKITNAVLVVENRITVFIDFLLL